MLTISLPGLLALDHHIWLALHPYRDQIQNNQELSTEDLEQILHCHPSFKIDDPLILDVHRRLLGSVQPPLDTETFTSSLIMVYMWYRALKEEERLGSSKVPHLKSSYVEEALPNYLCSTENTKEYDLTDMELDAIWPLFGMACHLLNVEPSQSTMLYPLLVLNQLLNEELQRIEISRYPACLLN